MTPWVKTTILQHQFKYFFSTFYDIILYKIDTIIYPPIYLLNFYQATYFEAFQIYSFFHYQSL